MFWRIRKTCICVRVWEQIINWVEQGSLSVCNYQSIRLFYSVSVCLSVCLSVSMSIGLVTIAKQYLSSSNRTRFLFAPAVWREGEASSTNMATNRHRKSKALQNKLDVDRHRKQKRAMAAMGVGKGESGEYWQEWMEE